MEKESLYFKNNDGVIYHAVLDYDMDAQNPRDWSNLGKMVFKNHNRYSLGDEQPEYYNDFFKEQISENEPSNYFEGYFEFELPSLEKIENDENFSRFIAGTKENGFRFDKELYDQEIKAILSNIKEELKDECEELNGGIPVDDNTNRLTDVYRINLRTINCSDYVPAEYCLNMIKSKLSENLENLFPKNFFNYSQDSIIFYDELDELTESQLYEKWAATKFCVIPINIHEHSGITCYAAPLRKTLRVANDKDDGFIYNDGFIYLDKDNPEIQEELKNKSVEEVSDWAKEILKGEIEIYARYLEGDCSSLRIEKFDKETLNWDEIENVGGFYGGDLDSILKDNGYDIFETIREEDAEKLPFTITDEYKKHVYDDFIGEIKKLLPELDNNIVHAFKAIQFNLKKSDLQYRTALDQYLVEHGCSDKDKTVEMITESLGIKTQLKESKTLSFMDENLNCYYCVNKNKNSSALGSPHAALLVDLENRCYSYVTGVEYMLSKPSETYLKKVIKLPSKKALEERLINVISCGFKNVPAESRFDGYSRDTNWIKKYVLKEHGISR